MASDPASNGPVLPSKPELHAIGRRMGTLSERLREFAGSGPTASHAHALATLERMRALLGEA